MDKHHAQLPKIEVGDLIEYEVPLWAGQGVKTKIALILEATDGRNVLVAYVPANKTKCGIMLHWITKKL